jgi:hypothetical protein
MSLDHPGVRAPHAAPQDLPVLSLEIHQMLGMFEWQTIRADFAYDPDAPLVVGVTFFDQGGRPVTWSIGRDLLQQGLHSMSGIGDIQVWPSLLAEQATAWLQLFPGDVAALFELPVAPLATWLEHTYEVVPAGTEMNRLGLDDFVAGLLDR